MFREKKVSTPIEDRLMEYGHNKKEKTKKKAAEVKYDFKPTLFKSKSSYNTPTKTRPIKNLKDKSPDVHSDLKLFLKRATA